MSARDDEHEYLLDLTLLASVRVKATSLKNAREKVRLAINGNEALSFMLDDEAISREVEIEGEIDCAEIDGEAQ